MWETVVLKGTEQQRLVVLNRVLMGDLTAAEAATALGRSVRQVRRMLAAYRKEGAAALAHGNRGRTPAHALAPRCGSGCRAGPDDICRLNDTHLSELLAEREGIVLSRAHGAADAAGAGLERPRSGVPRRIGGGGNARPKPGCCCNSMPVRTPGWRSGDRG